MLDLLKWFLVLEAMGFAALPLVIRAFRNLPDRGYAFARPVGALAVAVVLWAGCTFGLWSNNGATVLLLVGVIAVAGWLSIPEAAAELRSLWTNRRAQLLAVEALFIGAFLVWAFVRAHIPNIEATEKPMELGFLNGIIRSSRFPPADPWLSGYSISYYYLGYVVVAAIAEASGVDPAVAFNLAIATLFAAAVTGSFALGHALVDGARAEGQGPATSVRDGSEISFVPASGERPGWIAGGLTAVFVALLGNLEGVFELLHARGFGSTQFWQSLAIWHLDHPFVSQQWYPTEAQDNWWWFRASRVILDYPSGTPPPDGYNTITEFPFFSFLLGDLHPHLLALPFAFVCLAFALSFLREPGEFPWKHVRTVAFDAAFIVFLFGSMFLLNAWDILTYLFVLVCAFAARRYVNRPRFDLSWLRDVAAFGAVALVVSVLAYFPFYLTFRSQATGLLGVVRLHSHLSYFVIFWGPLLFLAASLVATDFRFARSRSRADGVSQAGPAWIQSSLVWVVVAALVAVAIYVDAPALALVIPIGFSALVLTLRYLADAGAAATGPDPESKNDRRVVVTPSSPEAQNQPVGIAGGAPTPMPNADKVYVLILLFVAMLLLFGTELVYIEDSFNSRMNTVFKLYFQAWELLAIVGGYTMYVLGRAALSRGPMTETVPALRSAASESLPLGSNRWALPRPIALTWLAAATVLILAAGVYAPAALASRTDEFTTELNLNGLSYYERFQPDDAAGIAWLTQNVKGTATIVEAIGGSYSAFGEVAWMTGLPTILGWDFHEIQWHGAAIIPVEDERKRDIDLIYRSSDWRVAQELLRKYSAQFVYVGPMERRNYAQNEAALSKFSQFMDVPYRNPGVTIYQSRGKN